MNNLLQVDFENKNIRFVEHPEGKFEFGIIAKDLALVLEYVRYDGKPTTDRLITLVDEEYRGTQETSTPSGTQSMSIIWEAGVYQALSRTNKPKAKPFQKKLYEEVLPQIRKTGKYENQQNQMSPIEILEQMLETYKHQQQRIENNTQEIEQTKENLETTINDVEILKERIENNRNSSEIGNILVTLRKYFDIKNIELDRKLIGAGKKLSKLCRIAEIDFKDNGIGQSNEYPYWLMEVLFQTITDLDCDMHDLLTLYIRHYSSEKE